jgi:hypothetical protein
MADFSELVAEVDGHLAVAKANLDEEVDESELTRPTYVALQILKREGSEDEARVAILHHLCHEARQEAACLREEYRWAEIASYFQRMFAIRLMEGGDLGSALKLLLQKPTSIPPANDLALPCAGGCACAGK